MSRKNILLILVLAFGGLGPVYGQENINSTVNVSREFDGKLEDIQKSKFNTSYSDTLLKLNLNFDYTAFDSPYKDLYEFTPVEGIQLQNKGEAKYPVLFFKGAIGYPIMPEADLYIQPRTGGRHSLLFYGNHSSLWGNKGVDSPVNRSRTKGGLSYGWNWKSGEVRLNGFYKHNFHNFKKTDFFSYDPNLSQNIGGNLTIKSLNPEQGKLGYNFSFSAISTNLRDYLKEIYFDGSLDMDFKLAGAHNLALCVEYEGSVYNTELTTVVQKGSGGLISVVPKYRYQKDRFELNAGVGFAAVYGAPYSEEKRTDCANIYPEIDFTYEAVKDALWLNAELDGENSFISGYEILELNPWMRPKNVANYSIPVRAGLGLRGAVKDVFGYSLSGKYVRHNKFMSFYSLYASQFVSAVENVNEWRAEAAMHLKTKSVDFVVNGLYRYFGEAEVYMVPDWKVEGRFEYNYMGRIYAGVDVKYYSKMDGRGIIYDGFVNLGANLKYVINPKFTVFAEGRNLLNQQIFYLQDYVEPGINFALGIFIKL